MFDRILVPTDGSDLSTRAMEAVVPLATTFESTIHIVHVLSMGEISPALRDETRDELTERGQAITSAVRDVASNAGLETTVEVIETTDSIHETLVEYTTDHDIDLLAMGTSSPSGLSRFLMGSITRRTLRAVDVPVLTVNPDTSPSSRVESILLPTDGSAGAEAAAEYALDLAEALDASLHVINVVDVTGPWETLESDQLISSFEMAGQEAVDSVLERSEQLDISSVQASVLDGSPSEVTIEYATDKNLDLIVMGTHGRSGLDRVLLGSVAERVIGHAIQPVVTAKSTD